jgi:hypothetical protein
MKKAILFTILEVFVVIGLCMSTVAYAADEQIDLTWSLETLDDDTQHFRLYINTTDDFATATQLGPDLMYNPLAPDEVFQFPEMQITVPDGEDVSRYFWVTSVDTSGNECGPGYTHQVCMDNPPEMVRVDFDNLPPIPPTGLTVTARVIVNIQ